MKKPFGKILAALGVLLVILFLSRNFIARKSVEYGAKKITGFPLEIGSVNVGVFSSKVDVRDLKLLNPPEYQEKMFVDMPELYIDYRLRSMLSGAPHINDMLINIKQLVVVKNGKGDSNAMKLKGVVSGGGGSSKYTIDKLRIHIGTVTLKDFSHPKPTEHNTQLDIDVTYPNITDSTDISRLVMLTVMSQVKLPDIGIKPDDLKKGLSNVTNQAGVALKDTDDAVGSMFGGIKKLISQSDKK